MGTDRPRVFVVDDDAGVAQGLAMLLRTKGYSAKGFSSAEEFLAETNPADWHCGVIDVQMPGMGGFGLIQHLLANGAPPPSALLMTGKLTEEVARRATAAGLPDVLPKPLNSADVLEAVRLAMGRIAPIDLDQCEGGGDRIDAA